VTGRARGHAASVFCIASRATGSMRSRAAGRGAAVPGRPPSDSRTFRPSTGSGNCRAGCVCRRCSCDQTAAGTPSRHGHGAPCR
jgi:hypothetical protein